MTCVFPKVHPWHNRSVFSPGASKLLMWEPVGQTVPVQSCWSLKWGLSWGEAMLWGGMKSFTDVQNLLESLVDSYHDYLIITKEISFEGPDCTQTFDYLRLVGKWIFPKICYHGYCKPTFCLVWMDVLFQQMVLLAVTRSLLNLNLCSGTERSEIKCVSGSSVQFSADSLPSRQSEMWFIVFSLRYSRHVFTID